MFGLRKRGRLMCIVFKFFFIGSLLGWQSTTLIVGGPVKVFPPICFFFSAKPYFLNHFWNTKNGTDEHQKRRGFLTNHINIMITLAHYCPPINHIMQWYWCLLPLYGKLATLWARWNTFNAPWWLPIFDIFLVAVCKKQQNAICWVLRELRTTTMTKSLCLLCPPLK